MRNYRVLSIVFLAALLFVTSVSCWAAANVDIAISTQAGWFGQAAADREMQLVVDTVKNKVNDIQLFPAAQQPELANWLTDHTGNKQLDILIICGQFPSSIYKPGNAQTNDSIAEKFLEGGNMIANTGDWMFYVVDGAGTNGPGGLQNMMDIPGISMSDDDTPVKVTADGKKYLPTLQDYTTDRPFHLNELLEPWEAEIIFAQNTAGTRAEPVVVKDTSNGGRIATFYQTAGQDADPRGKLISEFITNWIPTIAGKVSVESEDKLSTLWGKLKVSN
jgi:hypothetical protein